MIPAALGNTGHDKGGPMNMMLRFAVSAVGATVLALAAPTAASAATGYTDSASGFEVYATSTTGYFVGTAGGDLPGSWNATVQHTVLSPSGVVTGGYVNLATSVNGTPALVTGAVTGGSVTRQNPGSTGCVNQYYAVILQLSNVGAYGSGTGTGGFSGTLIHRRHSVYGYCLTYAATISGGLTLSF